MRIPIEITLTYFKPSGKYYAEKTVTWDVQVIPIPKACTYTVYMADVMDQLKARQAAGEALPGLSHPDWDGAILLTCANGVSRLVLPEASSESAAVPARAASKSYSPGGTLTADDRQRALTIVQYGQTIHSMFSGAKRAEFAQAELTGRLPRGPDGLVDNCLLATEGLESNEYGPCQMCKGTCPDRDRLPNSRKDLGGA